MSKELEIYTICKQYCLIGKSRRFVEMIRHRDEETKQKAFLILYFSCTISTYPTIYFQDDDEGHLTAFHCVEDLMSKGKDIFLVHFVRLGVLNRIKEISETYDKEDLDITDPNTGTVRLLSTL